MVAALPLSLSPSLPLSVESRGQSCGMGTCKVPLRSAPAPPFRLLPSGSPLSFRPPRMPATMPATPVITTRVAAEAVVVERVLYAARAHGRRERTYDLRFRWQRGQCRGENATNVGAERPPRLKVVTGKFISLPRRLARSHQNPQPNLAFIQVAIQHRSLEFAPSRMCLAVA